MKTSFNRLFLFFGAFSLLVSTGFAYSVPEEVQNPTASEKDGSIYLEWDPGFSADDVIIGYKIYYGVKSVQTEDDFYDNEVVTGAETNYLFEGMANGSPYFFAITALDSQENESATYSKEASFIMVSEEPVIETPIVEEQPVIETPIIEEPEVETPPQQVEASQPIDTLAPMDASGLKVDSTKVDEGMVSILWTRSIDLDYDVQDQVIFTKKGLSAWDGGISVGKNIERIDLDVEPNQNYEIRVVTIDETGNESDGVSVVFSTKLAQSGASSYLPFIFGAIFLVLMFSWKQRRG